MKSGNSKRSLSLRRTKTIVRLWISDRTTDIDIPIRRKDKNDTKGREGVQGNSLGVRGGRGKPSNTRYSSPGCSRKEGHTAGKKLQSRNRRGKKNKYAKKKRDVKKNIGDEAGPSAARQSQRRVVKPQ